MQRITVKSAIE